MRRSFFLAVVPALALSVSCGDDADGGAFDTMPDSSGTAADSGTGSVPPDMPAETGTAEASGDGDGDPATGDGDGEPGDGDGDPTTSGDGDGDATTTTGGDCGNDVVDIGEQCDGIDLNGFTCTDLGYDGGDLACDPVTCTYDASGCTTDGGNTSGGTTG